MVTEEEVNRYADAYVKEGVELFGEERRQLIRYVLYYFRAGYRCGYTKGVLQGKHGEQSFSEEQLESSIHSMVESMVDEFFFRLSKGVESLPPYANG